MTSRELDLGRLENAGSTHVVEGAAASVDKGVVNLARVSQPNPEFGSSIVAVRTVTSSPMSLHETWLSPWEYFYIGLMGNNDRNEKKENK
ncbi:hypothetical protein J6590_088848 [Homalodisca vitripennis]|nr:hypothetical protein J6590_088848 [Homalodisca vitripennis]